MKRIHGEPIPFHKLHGYEDKSPVPCDFKLGDKVIFKNDSGLEFNCEVRAFSKEIGQHDAGRFIYVFPDNDAWWFPVHPSNLKLCN